jgi:IS30 family transposase
MDKGPCSFFLKYTITADNGCEFHSYKRLEQRLGTTVYFATPHHAWERATNENTNGLLRQYLPKRTCRRDLTQRPVQRQRRAPQSPTPTAPGLSHSS